MRWPSITLDPYMAGLCIGGNGVCNIGSEELCGKRQCYIHLEKYVDDQLNEQMKSDRHVCTQIDIIMKYIHTSCVFDIQPTISMLINSLETELLFIAIISIIVSISVIVIFTHMYILLHLRSLHCTSELFMLFIFSHRHVAWQSLYFNKGKLKGGGDYYYKHPWVFLTYRDLG